MNVWVYYHSMTVVGGGERHVLATIDALEMLGYDPVLVVCGFNHRVPRVLGYRVKGRVLDLCPGSGGLTARSIARMAARLVLHNPEGIPLAFQGVFSHLIPRAAPRGVLYSLSPPRSLWDPEAGRLQGGLSSITTGPAGEPLRILDRIVSRRFRVYAANSYNVARRVARAYGVWPVRVVYPPVDVEKYTPTPPGDYYLVVSRLEPHKRIHVILEAFLMVDEELYIVGSGPLLDWARRLVETHDARNITLLGNVGEDKLVELYEGAKAVIYMPANEDLGLVPIEAAAAGKATIASPEGGILETVVEGVNGFYVQPNPWSLARLVSRLDAHTLKPMVYKARRWAERWAMPRYIERLRALLESAGRID